MIMSKSGFPLSSPMRWIEQQIQSWQAIIDWCHRTNACPHYTERAYRTRDGYQRLLNQR